MMADTHNGAGASQRIVSQRLPTMRRNSLQQCPAMPTTMRGIACGREAEVGEVPPSLTLLPPLVAITLAKIPTVWDPISSLNVSIGEFLASSCGFP